MHALVHRHGANHGGQVVNAPVPGGCRGVTVPRQVEGQHPVIAGQVGGHAVEVGAAARPSVNEHHVWPSSVDVVHDLCAGQ